MYAELDLELYPVELMVFTCSEKIVFLDRLPSRTAFPVICANYAAQLEAQHIQAIIVINSVAVIL